MIWCFAMLCIFFDGKGCHAERTDTIWKVDDDTKKKYCTTNDFRSCERFMAVLQLEKKS